MSFNTSPRKTLGEIQQLQFADDDDAEIKETHVVPANNDTVRVEVNGIVAADDTIVAPQLETYVIGNGRNGFNGSAPDCPTNNAADGDDGPRKANEGTDAMNSGDDADHYLRDNERELSAAREAAEGLAAISEAVVPMPIVGDDRDAAVLDGRPDDEAPSSAEGATSSPSGRKKISKRRKVGKSLSPQSSSSAPSKHLRNVSGDHNINSNTNHHNSKANTSFLPPIASPHRGSGQGSNDGARRTYGYSPDDMQITSANLSMQGKRGERLRRAKAKETEQKEAEGRLREGNAEDVINTDVREIPLKKRIPPPAPPPPSEGNVGRQKGRKHSDRTTVGTAALPSPASTDDAVAHIQNTTHGPSSAGSGTENDTSNAAKHRRDANGDDGDTAFYVVAVAPREFEPLPSPIRRKRSGDDDDAVVATAAHTAAPQQEERRPSQSHHLAPQRDGDSPLVSGGRSIATNTYPSFLCPSAKEDDDMTYIAYLSAQEEGLPGDRRKGDGSCDPSVEGPSQLKKKNTSPSSSPQHHPRDASRSSPLHSPREATRTAIQRIRAFRESATDTSDYSFDPPSYANGYGTSGHCGLLVYRRRRRQTVEGEDEKRGSRGPYRVFKPRKMENIEDTPSTRHATAHEGLVKRLSYNAQQSIAEEEKEGMNTSASYLKRPYNYFIYGEEEAVVEAADGKLFTRRSVATPFKFCYCSRGGGTAHYEHNDGSDVNGGHQQRLALTARPSLGALQNTAFPSLSHTARESGAASSTALVTSTPDEALTHHNHQAHEEEEEQTASPPLRLTSNDLALTYNDRIALKREELEAKTMATLQRREEKRLAVEQQNERLAEERKYWGAKYVFERQQRALEKKIYQRELTALWSERTDRSPYWLDEVAVMGMKGEPKRRRITTASKTSPTAAKMPQNNSEDLSDEEKRLRAHYIEQKKANAVHPLLQEGGGDEYEDDSFDAEDEMAAGDPDELRTSNNRHHHPRASSSPQRLTANLKARRTSRGKRQAPRTFDFTEGMSYPDGDTTYTVEMVDGVSDDEESTAAAASPPKTKRRIVTRERKARREMGAQTDEIRFGDADWFYIYEGSSSDEEGASDGTNDEYEYEVEYAVVGEGELMPYSRNQNPTAPRGTDDALTHANHSRKTTENLNGGDAQKKRGSAREDLTRNLLREIAEISRKNGHDGGDAGVNNRQLVLANTRDGSVKGALTSYYAYNTSTRAITLHTTYNTTAHSPSSPHNRFDSYGRPLPREDMLALHKEERRLRSAEDKAWVALDPLAHRRGRHAANALYIGRDTFKAPLIEKHAQRKKATTSGSSDDEKEVADAESEKRGEETKATGGTKSSGGHRHTIATGDASKEYNAAVSILSQRVHNPHRYREGIIIRYQPGYGAIKNRVEKKNHTPPPSSSAAEGRADDDGDNAVEQTRTPSATAASPSPSPSNNNTQHSTTPRVVPRKPSNATLTNSLLRPRIGKAFLVMQGGNGDEGEAEEAQGEQDAQEEKEESQQRGVLVPYRHEFSRSVPTHVNRSNAGSVSFTQSESVQRQRPNPRGKMVSRAIATPIKSSAKTTPSGSPTKTGTSPRNSKISSATAAKTATTVAAKPSAVNSGDLPPISPRSATLNKKSSNGSPAPPTTGAQNTTTASSAKPMSAFQQVSSPPSPPPPQPADGEETATKAEVHTAGAPAPEDGRDVSTAASIVLVGSTPMLLPAPPQSLVKGIAMRRAMSVTNSQNAIHAASESASPTPTNSVDRLTPQPPQPQGGEKEEESGATTPHGSGSEAAEKPPLLSGSRACSVASSTTHRTSRRSSNARSITPPAIVARGTPTTTGMDDDTASTITAGRLVRELSAEKQRVEKLQEEFAAREEAMRRAHDEAIRALQLELEKNMNEKSRLREAELADGIADKTVADAEDDSGHANDKEPSPATELDNTADTNSTAAIENDTPRDKALPPSGHQVVARENDDEIINDDGHDDDGNGDAVVNDDEHGDGVVNDEVNDAVANNADEHHADGGGDDSSASAAISGDAFKGEGAYADAPPEDADGNADAYYIHGRGEIPQQRPSTVYDNNRLPSRSGLKSRDGAAGGGRIGRGSGGPSPADTNASTSRVQFADLPENHHYRASNDDDDEYAGGELRAQQNKVEVADDQHRSGLLRNTDAFATPPIVGGGSGDDADSKEELHGVIVTRHITTTTTTTRTTHHRHSVVENGGNGNAAEKSQSNSVAEVPDHYLPEMPDYRPDYKSYNAPITIEPSSALEPILMLQQDLTYEQKVAAELQRMREERAKAEAMFMEEEL